ncbi:site-specific DNA methylase [Cenarchaeum symbiosum A]|uniref:site-specific DNA-methyltransferase (adenine-specific) n=1 Tax=Cenarchaeum symbiosum (strain A) TaxID=414004 RepID=A0RUM2_CENSY|nr:site-specific DNA methylase [Cenarchaeum symbiosum A]
MLSQQYGLEQSPIRPFVKWAGGKRQIIPVLQGFFPRAFGEYHEPFLGGGAVLFHMLSGGRRHKCHASDLNGELVLAYEVVRDSVEDLISALEEHARAYNADKSGHYYEVRAAEPRGDLARVSRMIFLNRTCFNGLYRVNKRGRFNVPLGRYSNPGIVNAENLRAVSATLRSGRVSIGCHDFVDSAEDAKRGDFVYFDPPYQPVSRTASFTSYTRADFGAEDLARLAGLCRRLDARGCHVMLSNSNTPEVRSHFGNSWKTRKVRANRAINSDSGGRSGHTELVITNY